jgi:protein-tyrosine phosphatase
MAQAIGQGLAAECGRPQQFRFDSAGTHAHHTGERPDLRAQAALLRRGYTVGNIRSRRVDAQDFQNFDLILAMDASNAADLRRLCPPEHLSKIRLLLEFAEGLSEIEVPDPYYGNAQGFERVLDLCEAGIKGLINY